MARRYATPLSAKKRLVELIPGRHVAMVGLLSLAGGLLAFALSGPDAEANRRSEPLLLSIANSPSAEPAQDPGPALLLADTRPEIVPASPIEPADAPEPEMVPQWTSVTVRRGDSLSRIFNRIGLNDQILYRVMKSNDQAANLKRLHPGEEIGFQLEENQLLAIRYRKSALETVYIERSGDNYTSRKVLREPETRVRYSHATITDNLFLAGERAQLSHNIIMSLANIFGGVIDFVYDPRKGDAFSVMYEERYLDGEKLGDGKILAASFTNRGTTYPAYYYRDSNGKAGFYNEQGVSMRKAFLRAPVDFTRISSNFNPRRLHPIFKTKRPHRGIDYAASRGTPVLATGDGRVVRAGYSRANGNFLVIKHGEAFVTKYLHLHKKQVKKGQRVRQGQIIGQVGSTGFATGPHLHYEFLLNGVHRNPRTIHRKLPKAESVAKAEIPQFKAALQPLQAQFASHSGSRLLASADHKKTTDN